MNRTFIATTAAVALLLCATGLQAQVSPTSQPGVTGPIITTSDVASGAFVRANAANAGSTVDARAAAIVTTRLAMSGLTDLAGFRVPVELQVRLRRALEGDTATLAALVAAIPAAEATALRQSLDRILVAPRPGQFARATDDFNRVVERADPGLLADPPAEFLAVHAILRALAAATLEASR
jgi:hypothetical protein